MDEYRHGLPRATEKKTTNLVPGPVPPQSAFSEPVSEGVIREISCENAYREPKSRGFSRSRRNGLSLLENHRLPDRLTWKIVGNFSVAIGTPHSVFEIHLHLVWVTKYRKPLLVGLTGHRVRDLIREICGGLDVHILKGHVSKDHVHLLVSIPPQVTISRLVQRLKGKTASKSVLTGPNFVI